MYNAMSYTWGRWALKDNQKLSVESIVVNGVPWKIPRIDPDVHFTVGRFENAIEQATKVSPQVFKYKSNWKELEARREESVPFPWLDVACIDQRFNSDAMSEIGRQGKIFMGALCVYVWLGHHSAQSLESNTNALSEVTVCDKSITVLRS
jgi:Heterokaryon incompatibility protein (HET)